MQLYWAGWMYAYIHFMSKERSRTIIEKLPLKEMLIEYKLGHEMSKETLSKDSVPDRPSPIRPCRFCLTRSRAISCKEAME